MMKKTIIVFSGGPDSTAAALWAISQGFGVELLTFQYSDKQSGEILAAKNIAQELKLHHTIIDFRSPMSVFSPDIIFLMHCGVSKRSLLPFGAGLVLSVAASYALHNGVHHITWGTTKDDGICNEEYSKQFSDQLASLITMSTGESFTIETPLSNMHKFEEFSLYSGKENLLKLTWSCKISENDTQCGICTACTARRVAAEFANIKDFTNYANLDFHHPFTAEERKDPSKIDAKVLAREGTCANPELSKDRWTIIS